MKKIILIIIMICLTGCTNGNTSTKPEQSPKETKTPEISIIPTPEASPTPDINREKSIEEIEELLEAATWEKTDVKNVWYGKGGWNNFTGDNVMEYVSRFDLINGEYYYYVDVSENERVRWSYYWNEDVSKIKDCQYNHKTQELSGTCDWMEEVDVKDRKFVFVSLIKSIGLTINDLNKLAAE